MMFARQSSRHTVIGHNIQHPLAGQPVGIAAQRQTQRQAGQILLFSVFGDALRRLGQYAV